ncbi:MAG: agmatine deiminase family protein [Candidatus Fermentibacteraceae bacterium]|nr:agmatine deiminase family protein [Candidatus Fermentibacteraceae bacterium]MBN2608947.1 agmatine deiminase family protein [Candidatus Fermentibacteraceae bacterium]
MRLIPEYDPVGRLYLSFVRDFYHSRFDYGGTICDIAEAVSGKVGIEVFVAGEEQPFFMELLRSRGIDDGGLILNPNSPLRGIVAEYFPVFCREEDGRGVGIHFRNDNLDLADYLHRFAGDIIDSLGIEPLRMEENFATARISVNGDLCLLSEDEPESPAAAARLQFFRSSFPEQVFRQVPSLTGDHTRDLDMFLWPVRPGIWLVSRYPEGTPQEVSVRPSLEAIRIHGHEAVMIPGLPPIRYGDVNTMPNYANGILVNGTALFPSYDRTEDEQVGRMLESMGYEAIPVDCRKIIESNSGLHCISKTVPSSLLHR